MSLETDELKAQIIRTFKRQLNDLGITRIELVTKESPHNTMQSRAPAPSQFQQLKAWATSSMVVRVFEIALLISVLPTILPNVKMNYKEPIATTLACIESVQRHMNQPTSTTDPLAPLLPHTSEMAESKGPLKTPTPADDTGYSLDLRRPNRARNRRLS
ncbi:hypothetical protein BVX99_02790 [bacterium F16]|nr:hypothetical protein BVX99_02790 [bacterium F16]